MKRQAGFTLVELLLAVSVMALLAVLAWRGVDSMVRAQAAIDERADSVLALQTGLAQWGADLDALAMLPQTTALDWNGRVLRITRRETGQALAGVRVVAWTRREGQWLRWQSPHLATRGDVDTAWEQADVWSQTPDDLQRSLQVAVTPLSEWQLFFFRDGSWSNPLSSDASDASPGPAAEPAARANTTAGALVPDGVRLVLVLPPGQAVSGRIVRDWVSPRIGGGKS